DKKAGINLDRFDFVVHVIRSGELFQKVVAAIEENKMPPPSSPAMSNADRDTMVAGILKILEKALAKPDPGPTVMRRLSHREYMYTIRDLLGVDFDALSYFPAEASGGEGFDNQAGVLYMTPLLMERYYMAADSVVRQARLASEIWRELMPKNYRPGPLRRFSNWWKQTISKQEIYWGKPANIASKIILPFATKAYRRFLDVEEEKDLISFFEKIYFQEWRGKNGFEIALTTVFKKVLVSPSFLFRMEANLPINESYPVNNFELATRLSYLLWSSMPDDLLLNVAYRENLHDPKVLRRETKRMIDDPKFERFANTFAPQWLGVQELMFESKPDKDKFPEFTPSLREAMYSEVVEYFSHVFSKGNLLQFIDSDFGLINAELARHYGIDGVEGQAFQAVHLDDRSRGGVLGMGAVLTATSLPERTSPVLRGQWVMEQLLGERVPPPPPDVPELEAAKAEVHDELDLRSLLELHRFPSSCQPCHKKMDPIGFGLENFDAIGRWRDKYGTVAIDASGELEDGVVFNGPIELKNILLEEKEKFARNFTRKLLSFALGRGVEFLDSRTINDLTNQLIENNFDGSELLVSLVNSYPFRHRRSDLADRYKDNKL
ncbi:MAG: DUF1592 domain-containing protein, partial [Saprospiraceae bacterium]|nr:DUF1592 domain-containing protein [Saprospiraceae bacterium]